jgi:hypothetical protein
MAATQLASNSTKRSNCDLSRYLRHRREVLGLTPSGLSIHGSFNFRRSLKDVSSVERYTQPVPEEAKLSNLLYLRYQVQPSLVRHRASEVVAPHTGWNNVILEMWFVVVNPVQRDTDVSFPAIRATSL